MLAIAFHSYRPGFGLNCFLVLKERGIDKNCTTKIRGTQIDVWRTLQSGKTNRKKYQAMFRAGRYFFLRFSL